MNEDGIRLEILSETEEKMHAQFEIIFLYVIRGELCVLTGDSSHTLLQEDVLLLNFGEEHSLSADRDTMFCKVTIPYPLIMRGTDRDFLYFRCDSTQESGYRYQKLRDCMKKLLLAYIEEENTFLVESARYGLLDCLVRYFAVDEKKGGAYPPDLQKNRLLGDLLRYIYANLGGEISLNEAAEKVAFMTPSSLSRFFSRQTGESFVKYVRRIRLAQAAGALENTEDPISKIAVDNGFSNPSAMNRDFRDYYGVTPTEYRMSHRADRKKEAVLPDRGELIRLIGTADVEDTVTGKRTCYVDLHAGRSYRRWTAAILNAGPAYSLDSARMQEQLLFLKERLDVEYIRIWSIFSAPMMLFGEGKRRAPNYAKVDEVLDFCVENRMKVFLDLGQRDNTVMASSDAVLYEPKVGITFGSRQEWNSFLAEFLAHIVKRYGKDTVSGWIFEFTFFLNERPYYESDRYRAKDVWNDGYRIIRQYLPDAKIAGPGLLVSQDEELTDRIVGDFLADGCLPDIFTSMNFPIGTEMETRGYQRVTDDDFVKREAQMVRDSLTKHGFTGKYYITDWGITLANRNYIQDSCHKATDLLRTILETYPLVDAMGIFYASDLINVYSDSGAPLSGSGGLVSRDGIGKPSLYAYEFLRHMGSRLLYQGEGILVTADESACIRCILYNNRTFNAGYFMQKENSFRPGELERLFADHQKVSVELNIGGAGDHTDYLIREKTVNPGAGSVLDNWTAMGCEEDLLPSDIAYLKDISVPRVTLAPERTVDGTLHLLENLEPHEIRWILIEKR